VEQKFAAALPQVYPAGTYEEILALASDQDRLERTPVHDFMAMLSTPGDARGAGGPARPGGEKAEDQRAKAALGGGGNARK
jgi:hypothetical protein